MKKWTILLGVSFFVHLSTLTLANVFDDGQLHIINDATYENAKIRLDYRIDNNPGTKVSLIGDAIVDEISLFNNAHVNIVSGTVNGMLYAVDNATVEMSGGFVHDLQAAGHAASIVMRGGRVDLLAANDNSSVTMSGGKIGTFYMVATGNGKIFLEGDEFVITDLYGKASNLSYGDKLSDFGTYVEFQPYGIVQDYYSGNISGILNDGSVLDVEFRVCNHGVNLGTADIIIVPEPTTLLLFGLGGLALRRRFSGN